MAKNLSPGLNTPLAQAPVADSDSSSTTRALRWGVAFGVMQAATPLAFWWLTPATVHALAIVLIAAVYIGFAVGDGRPRVIVAECVVVSAFVVLAAAAVTATAWLLVIAYAAHGVKDLWQHRHHFVRGTRWWPPFCLAVDGTVAAIVAVQIAAGVQFRP
jgi:hypothetical protein